MSLSELPPGFDLSKIPMIPPPPGVTPNFINPESRAWTIYVASAVCLALTFIFFTARMYSKIFVVKKRSIDDYAAAVALICVVIYSGLNLGYFNGAYGIHFWNLTLTSITNHQEMIVLITNCFYGPCIFAVKCSIFLLFLTIFGELRWMRILVWIGLLITGLFYFAALLVFSVSCAPRNGENYLLSFANPRCGARTITFSLVMTSFSIASDFYLFILPIPAVLGLQMRTGKKLGILAIFMTGLSACIVSCVSLWSRIYLKTHTDLTRDLIPVNLTVIIEMNVGMWVASMPACAGLVNKHAIPFIPFFTKVHSKFAGVGSRFSLPLFNKQSSSEKQYPSSSQRAEPTIQNNRPLRYVTLTDDVGESRESLYRR